MGELVAFEPFNDENVCHSISNFEVYGIEIDSEGNNMLTNKQCQKIKNGFGISKFTISEIEVWELTFVD